MYAVIKTGGKQYRVTEGQTLKVEKLEVEEGASVEFDTVLMVADGDRIQVGAPYLEGARVTATVESQGRGPKIRIVKFRRRKHYRKTQGHRQSFTELRISGISGSSDSGGMGQVGGVEGFSDAAAFQATPNPEG